MWLVSGERGFHQALWHLAPRPLSASWGFCGVRNTWAALTLFFPTKLNCFQGTFFPR